VGPEDSRDFVEREVNELGESAGQDSTSAFRNSGAIAKGVKNHIGKGGANIEYFHIWHF